jgi:paraquat-inducible protein B
MAENVDPTPAGQASVPPVSGADTSSMPKPVIVRARRLQFSLVWLVPLVALLVGLVLVVRTLLQTGPLITITFPNAEGLEPGRTEVRFKEVVVGRVTKVGFSPDRGRVMATVRLDKTAANLAVSDTQFWVVRPRISTAGISGLGTLFSGAYIDTDAGESAQDHSHFTGLEVPPFALRGEPGRRFVLDATDLGSLEVGSPVYYRRTRVGRVVGYALDPRRDVLEVQVLVEAPNDALVTTQTRFWNAGGIDVQMGSGGLSVNTESIASLVVGGIAFATPPTASSATAKAPAAAAGQRFVLHSDKRAAMAPPDGTPVRVRMRFASGYRGLAAGAAVEMLGVDVGTVHAVTMKYDARSTRFALEVLADIHPARLGDARREFLNSAAGAQPTEAQLIKLLVERGLRARVMSGNLLTGQQLVALDLQPQAPKATVDTTQATLFIPSHSGGGDLQQQASEIMERVGRIRFEQIGASLEATLKNTQVASASLPEILVKASAATSALQQALGSADSAIQQVSPQAQQALVDVQKSLKALQGTLDGLDRNLMQPDAPLQRDASKALAEMQRAARALRVLGDYLQQHPETLLKGKPADADVGPTVEGRR